MKSLKKWVPRILDPGIRWSWIRRSRCAGSLVPRSWDSGFVDPGILEPRIVSGAGWPEQGKHGSLGNQEPGASGHNWKNQLCEDLWGYDPKITHRRDKRFIRIAFSVSAPMPPIDSCKSGTLWRRWPGLAPFNYNNIISKQGRNYPTLVFTEENRGVVACLNPGYPGALFHFRLHARTWSNSFW